MADTKKVEAKKTEAKAIAKFIRLSSRKAREVVDLIRGKDLREALAILKYTPRKASAPVAKVVQSAAANAENNYEMNRDNLYVAECYVDQGPTMKRFKPRAMGRADLLRRRTSHITIVLKEKPAK